jgi:glycosyltransferase involved in cell wall biosynthesis
MARVVVLTSVHPMTDIRIFRKECRSLARAGHDVTLVATDNGSEPVEGIHVIRLPRPRRRWVRMTRTAWQVWRTAARLDADVYHFHDPELIPAGLLLRMSGKQVVYDIHEDVPRQIQSKRYLPAGFRAPIGACFEVFENAAARRFTALVASNPQIAERFTGLNPRTIVVQNFPMADELVAPSERPWDARDRAVAYVGGITLERGVREMVAAIGKTDATLELAGEFAHAGDREVAASTPGWDRVREHGQLDRRRVAELLARVRAGLVLFHPEPNHIRAQPNKMFEYMSAGIPVIASAFPLWRKIIEGERCGMLVDPLDPGAIAEALNDLLAHPREAEAMGRRGRAAVEARFNWSHEERRLLSLYETLGRPVDSAAAQG